MNEHRIDGDVQPGWEPVADAFRSNFEDQNEIGAAVSISVMGDTVVDLWGGIADPRTGRGWARDTTVLVFSSTKGATALCALMLVERGVLDLEAPVARYWPEFAANGKDAVLVRHLLTHEAGLPAVDVDLTRADLLAREPVLRALEAQAPMWEPGTRFAYHAVTFGHLVGEVIRRVDGRTLGRFFAEEVAGPLGMTASIGGEPPGGIEPAWLVEDAGPIPPELAAAISQENGPIWLFHRSVTLGSALPLPLVGQDGGGFNAPELRAVELGATTMTTDARSLARMYAAIVGEVDGTRLLSPELALEAGRARTTEKPYGLESADEPAVGMPRPFDFGLGFAASPTLLGPTALGHGGAGGSLGYGDIESGLAFGYVMNHMDAAAPDERAARLIAAVRSCL